MQTIILKTHHQIRILTLTTLLFFTTGLMNAQTIVTAQSNANWLGWMDIYDNTGTTHLTGSTWPVADLQTDLNPGFYQMTLYPNYNTYDANDPYWSNGTIGNKIMEANTYIEDPNLVGQNVTFTFDVKAQVLGPGYTAEAFIKVINPSNNNAVVLYNTLTIIDGALGIHSVSANVPNTPGLITQYGFMIRGLNANIADWIAHGWVWIDQAPTALSLSKIQLSATQIDQNIQLSWNTTNEQNLSTYVLERSIDAQSFEAIYSIDAQNTPEATYSYTDAGHSETNYYRVKSIAQSGEETYSEVRKVTATSASTVTIYPNPSDDLIYLDLNLDAEVAAEITLYDLSGRAIKSLKTITGPEPLEISTHELLTGTYLIQASYMGKTEKRVFTKK